MVGIEQKTPGHFVGMVAGNQPLTNPLDQSFMDYAESLPSGSSGAATVGVPLWGRRVFEIVKGRSWSSLGNTTHLWAGHWKSTPFDSFRPAAPLIFR